MRLQSIARSFVSGLVVYFVMAACASERSNNSSSSTSGSSSSSSGTSTSGALVDQLTNPVPDAKAAETASEQCNKTFQNGAATVYYAEHAYPGASAADLATSVAMIYPNGSNPPGYQNIYSITGWVRDGAVAVSCTNGTNVTFVRR